MLLNNILEITGNTPLARLNGIAAVYSCGIYVECEFLSLSSSVKDRVAINMIKPVDILIETTSQYWQQALSFAWL